MKISKALSLERKRRAWEMRLKYCKDDEIAATLGMTEEAVHKMLMRMNNKFKESLEKDIEKVKLAQIATLEKIVRDAFEAWEISKKAIKKIRDKTGVTIGGLTATEKSKETCYQDIDAPKGRQQENDASLLKVAGDPRHLKIAMEALAEIRAITGANAPIKSDVNLTNLTDAELEAEARKILGE